MTVPPAGPVDALGADRQELDEQAERARAEARLRLRRGRLVTVVVAGSLAVLVGVVALLGGFQRRQDLLTPVAPGSVITSGPYEVTLASATVQHRTSADEWLVAVTGTARTTGGTSIDPPTGESGFLFARGTATREVQASSSVALGTSAGRQGQDNLTPGLPAVPWTVTFRFAAAPGDSVLVVVFDQEYATRYLFSDEESWRPTNRASTTTMTLEKLPEQEY